METLISEIENKNLSIDNKLSKADELTTKLKVYDYISKQLLNIAEKWCTDNQSPVYWAAMNNKMETCSYCNNGQTDCGSNFYVIAQGIDATTVDYDFCNDCQSVYSVDENVCSACDSCETCNSCQGCDAVQSFRPTTCYSCYNACQGCDSCESCDTCQGCNAGQSLSCGSGWSTYGACESCYGDYNGSYSSCQSCNSCQSSYGVSCDSSYSYCYQSSYCYQNQ